MLTFCDNKSLVNAVIDFISNAVYTVKHYVIDNIQCHFQLCWHEPFVQGHQMSTENQVLKFCRTVNPILCLCYFYLVCFDIGLQGLVIFNNCGILDCPLGSKSICVGSQWVRFWNQVWKVSSQWMQGFFWPHGCCGWEDLCLSMSYGSACCFLVYLALYRICCSTHQHICQFLWAFLCITVKSVFLRKRQRRRDVFSMLGVVMPWLSCNCEICIVIVKELFMWGDSFCDTAANRDLNFKKLHKSSATLWSSFTPTSCVTFIYFIQVISLSMAQSIFPLFWDISFVSHFKTICTQSCK